MPPAWFAVNAQVPADCIVAVLPLIVHIAGVVLANTTGLPDEPPLADKANVPFGA